MKTVIRPETLGDEVFLAAVLPEKPSFDWLSVGQDCVQLAAEQIQELLAYVTAAKQPVELIKTQIRVV